MNDPLLFALSVFALLAVPGPTNTLLAGAGATRGVRSSLPLLIGEFGGYTLTITTLRLTLGTFVSEIAGIQVAMKWAVAAYLVFLAARLWRFSADAGGAFSVRRVFVTTLLNPKAFVFALFVFPAPPTPIAEYYLAFWAMVAAIGASWIVAGALLTRYVHPRFNLVVPRICAFALAVFAIVLVCGTLGR